MNKKLLILNYVAIIGLISCGKNSSSDSAPPAVAENPVESTPAVSSPTSGDNANNGDNAVAAPGTVDAGDTTDTGNAVGEVSLVKALGPNGVPDGYSTWAELNQIDPKTKNLVTLKGEDPVNALLGEDPSCSVYVLAHYLDPNGIETFAVRTSFSHNGDTHPYLLASVDPSALSVTAIDTDNKSQAFFKFSTAGDFLSSTTMNLKWFHINHFDTGVCEKLQIEAKN